MIVYGAPLSVSACPRIGRVAVEALLPDAMADERRRARLRAGPRPPRNCAPAAARSPKRRQQRGRGVKPDQLFRIPPSGQRERIPRRQREIAEDLLPLLHLEVAGIGKADARQVLRLVRRAQPDQPPGLAIRQRPEKHRVDHAEQRDVRADAKPEPDDGDEREPGRLQELTDGVAEFEMHGGLPHILAQRRAGFQRPG